MKKIILPVLFIVLVIVYLSIKNKQCLNREAKIYTVNGKKHCLLTADTQEEWEKGLMFYRKPTNFDGMIFIFPSRGTKSFWNKNTYMDLDVYWMDGNKVTGKSFLPSILKSKEIIFVESTEKVDKVVEIIK